MKQVVVQKAQTPQIDPRYVEETKQTMALLQEMVRGVLKRGIHYGRIPGTPADSLWDAGAADIIGMFRGYPGERRILKLDDDSQKIAVCLEVPIISRVTGEVITTGIAAASTLETRYKYRWVFNPAEWGYEGDAAKALKTKQEGGKTLHRILNPEHSELLNTVVKIASKRAEVDAAQSLPGVNSMLKQLFTPQQQKQGPRWDSFWGEMNRLGLNEAEVHKRLGVRSMKDWLSRGKSLEEAIDILRREQTIPEKSERKPEDITNMQQLMDACKEDWGLEPHDVCGKLGYRSTLDISEPPWNCYEQIRASLEG